MFKIKRIIVTFILLFLLVVTLTYGNDKNKKKHLLKYSTFIPYLDWKIHNTGNIKLMITNYGMIGGDNGLFTHPENFIKCEHPINSGIEHFEGGGIWIGAIIDTSSNPLVKKEIKKVTTGYEGWGGDGYSTGGGGLLNEMYPSSNQSDSIIVITKNSQKPNNWNAIYGNLEYQPISDQDFLCQYTDTILPSPDPMHIPLGIKIIQRSLSWKSNYFDEVIFIQYQIINLKRKPIRDIYIGFFMDMDIGPIKMQKEKYNAPRNYWEDNYAFFIDSLLLACIDNPIDQPSTPLGLSIIYVKPSIEKLKISFNWYTNEESPDPDSKRYDFLSNGIIKPNQSKFQCNDTRFLIGIGPFNFDNSDTIKIITSIVAGNNINSLIDNRKKAYNIYKDNFFVPSPPPSPKLSISYTEKGIKLNWSSSGNTDPENYVDYTNLTAKNLYNGKIFEGYRVYRAEGINPDKNNFVLLYQFDKPNNMWGYNTGLKYEIIDTNIVSGKTYTYSVTSYSIEDTSTNHYRESLESSIYENAIIAYAPYINSKKVSVVPNPYKGDGGYNQGIEWEGNLSNWTENNRLIRFINLPDKCTIRIFTVSGELVKEIYHNDSQRNWENWNLQTSSGRIVSSGIYIFNVESNEFNQTGKFVIIK